MLEGIFEERLYRLEVAQRALLSSPLVGWKTYGYEDFEDPLMVAPENGDQRLEVERAGKNLSSDPALLRLSSRH